MRWSRGIAYAVGLITTDGSLSIDGRHINLTSKDLDQIQTFIKILNLKNKIGLKYSSYTHEKKYYQVQFGNVKFYRFLLSIGLTPHKTKTLGSIKIPDRYFADFLRGHLDGDGYTYSYWDKRWKSSFMMYTGFLSASENHIEWLQKEIKRFFGLSGAIKFEGKSTFSLKFAKRESLILVGKMYYNKKVPCLKRKYFKIQACLDIISKQAEVGKLVYPLP
ncbi:MAG: hypothetical protein HYV37_03750 [Candidatus Levyibacteriota bacterium]|nr:MAG: hypothetical protein HYV37_03750 [Candidatus Levybacteria bacterium]